jgi:hypothetical protein
LAAITVYTATVSAAVTNLDNTFTKWIRMEIYDWNYSSSNSNFYRS